MRSTLGAIGAPVAAAPSRSRAGHDRPVGARLLRPHSRSAGRAQGRGRGHGAAPIHELATRGRRHGAGWERVQPGPWGRDTSGHRMTLMLESRTRRRRRAAYVSEAGPPGGWAGGEMDGSGGKKLLQVHAVQKNKREIWYQKNPEPPAPRRGRGREKQEG